jgi:predicted SnoaL-like aldol condensation-catalyzing enzyme
MNNKEIAISFLTLSSAGDVREANDKFIHPGFIHHNAYFKGDRESLLKGMEENAQTFPGKKYEALHVIQDGEFVAVHGKVTLTVESRWSVIHLFRFEKNMIREMWEASQEVLKDSPNENGLF